MQYLLSFQYLKSDNKLGYLTHCWLGFDRLKKNVFYHAAPTLFGFVQVRLLTYYVKCFSL